MLLKARSTEMPRKGIIRTPMPRKLSAVIITYNEEAKIERALLSLRPVCDEILVVDSFSEDATVEICRQHTQQVLQRHWAGYREQKQFATDQTAFDWVLSLDADEELSPELQNEITAWKESSEDSLSAYYLPRLTHFMGRWIRHTTWYPDWQLRLFRKSEGVWEGGRVHEAFKTQGSTGKMSGHLFHYTYSTISEYLVQLERFSTLAALDYYDRGRRAHLLHLSVYPAILFLKNYLIRLGFLDRTPGLVVSYLAAVSTFFKYLKLMELQKDRGSR